MLLFTIAYKTLQSVGISDIIVPTHAPSALITDPFVSNGINLNCRSNNAVSKQTLAYSTKHNLSTIQMAIKEHLFPVFKFFTHSKDVAYSADSNSVCQIVLQHTEIDSEHYQDCWYTFQGIVKTELTKKRNNVVGQLKRKFQSMFIVFLIV